MSFFAADSVGCIGTRALVFDAFGQGMLGLYFVLPTNVFCLPLKKKAGEQSLQPSGGGELG